LIKINFGAKSCAEMEISMQKEINRYVQGLQEEFFARKMRPKFHFSSPAGWMNDPYAPVWYRGEYHLFFNFGL